MIFFAVTYGAYIVNPRYFQETGRPSHHHRETTAAMVNTQDRGQVC